MFNLFLFYFLFASFFNSVAMETGSKLVFPNQFDKLPNELVLPIFQYFFENKSLEEIIENHRIFCTCKRFFGFKIIADQAIAKFDSGYINQKALDLGNEIYKKRTEFEFELFKKRVSLEMKLEGKNLSELGVTKKKIEEEEEEEDSSSYIDEEDSDVSTDSENSSSEEDSDCTDYEDSSSNEKDEESLDFIRKMHSSLCSIKLQEIELSNKINELTKNFILIIRFLINSNKLIFNIQDSVNKNNLAMICLMIRLPSLAKHLVNHVDIKGTNSNEHTIFQIAIIENYPDFLKLLLNESKRKKIKINKNELLYICCNENCSSTSCVKVLIEAGASVNKTNKCSQETPLVTALNNGNIKIARYLIEKGANVDKRSNLLNRRNNIWSGTPREYILGQNIDIQLPPEKNCTVM